MDGLWTEVCGQQKQSNDPGDNQHILNMPIIGRRWRANGTPCLIQHSPNTPTTGLRERGNDTRKSTGRSGQQKEGSSDPTQHAKGRTGDCPGPRKRATTRRNVTQGG